MKNGKAILPNADLLPSFGYCRRQAHSHKKSGERLGQVFPIRCPKADSFFIPKSEKRFEKHEGNSVDFMKIHKAEVFEQPMTIHTVQK